MNTEKDDRLGLPSASSMDRILACPGSFALEARCPEDETEASKVGTWIHEALAGSKAQLVGTPRETYEKCIEITNKILEAHSFWGADQYTEIRLWFHADDGRALFSGKPDRVYLQHRPLGIGNSRALIVDYKTLYGEHEEAPSNMQLRALAVLVARRYKVGSVIVALVQPNVSPQFTIAEYGPTDLAQSMDQILAGIKAATPEARRTPGDHCKWCKAKTICPEAARQVEKFVDEVASLGVAKMTPKERGETLNKIKFIGTILDPVWDEIKAMLIVDPGSVDGWRVKEGNRRRVIEDARAAYGKVAHLIGPQEFNEACSVSIGDLESVIKAHTGGTGAAVKALVNTLLGDLITIKQNAPSIERVK
jgi:hypothetical protein